MVGSVQAERHVQIYTRRDHDAGELLQPPRISTISVSSRGSGSGEVVTELLQGRTNCDEDWMNGVLKPAL